MMRYKVYRGKKLVFDTGKALFARRYARRESIHNPTMIFRIVATDEKVASMWKNGKRRKR